MAAVFADFDGLVCFCFMWVQELYSCSSQSGHVPRPFEGRLLIVFPRFLFAILHHPIHKKVRFFI
ncbi:hypothetical protein [Neobacillus drentensis]|uniref:hypothetical protein n=1 Tax=Neobacillus drentensis TaxID=220684 RepID=UPI0030003903